MGGTHFESMQYATHLQYITAYPGAYVYQRRVFSCVGIPSCYRGQGLCVIPPTTPGHVAVTQLRKTPLRSRPISAKKASAVSSPVLNEKPVSTPLTLPLQLASAMWPMKAAGDVGATSAPLPRVIGSLVARQCTSMFTCAEIASGPANTKVSTSGSSRSLSLATRPSSCTSKAPC